MAVETRVIIDANASNAIKEIGKLDEAAQDADKTIKELDDQTISVEVNADGMDALRQKGEDAIATVKALADTPVQLDTTNAKTNLDEVGKSADSSKSALANMVGNSAQDIGSVAGVSGSAGVAIGQMAEYMADASFEGENLGSVLKNFGAVAGPILLLTAGIQAVTGAMEAQKKRTEETKRVTTEFGEAMSGAADDSIGFADMLRDNQDAMSEFWTTSQLGEGFAADVANVINDAGRNVPLLGRLFQDLSVDVPGALNKVGISIHQFGTALNGTKADQQAFLQLLQDDFDAGLLTSNQLKATTQIFGEYAASVDAAREAQSLYNVDQGEANALLQELVAKNEPLSQMTETWKTLFTDMADGTIDTQGAATAINDLAAALGLTQEEVIGLAQQHVADELEKTGDAAGHASAKTRDLAAGYRDAKKAADDLTYANQLLRGDISQDQAWIHLQQQFDETKRRGVEAMQAVHDKTDDADSKMLDYQASVNDSKTAVMDFNDEWTHVDTDKTVELLTKVTRGQLDDALVDIGKATSTTHWIDVRVRTTVDQAWNRVMGTRWDG